MTNSLIKAMNYVWIKLKTYIIFYAPFVYFTLIWYIGKQSGAYYTKKYIFKVSNAKFLPI